MLKLYKKSEIWFALLWIIVYVIGTSAADSVSQNIGFPKLITLALHTVMCIAAFIFLKKNRLFKEYGICRTDISASRFLFYIPLVIACTCNLWYGLAMNMPLIESIMYFLSMLCVGFLEELIFRGFLFKAMSRSNVKSAIIVSSITFGIGHIVNLVNGSGADLISNLCQVFYAVAFGFLFVTIFYRGKTLLPCIIAHSAINALSTFANSAAVNERSTIIHSVILCVIAVAYTLILLKTLPKPEATQK